MGSGSNVFFQVDNKSESPLNTATCLHELVNNVLSINSLPLDISQVFPILGTREIINLLACGIKGKYTPEQILKAYLGNYEGISPDDKAFIQRASFPIRMYLAKRTTLNEAQLRQAFQPLIDKEGLVFVAENNSTLS